jgi:hypothetical protein
VDTIKLDDASGYDSNRLVAEPLIELAREASQALELPPSERAGRNEKCHTSYLRIWHIG